MHPKILHGFPDSDVEKAWRECLQGSDEASHYVSPEFLVEPSLHDQHLFAILAMEGPRVDGVLTGRSSGGKADSGLVSRPQICMRRGADSAAVAEAFAVGMKALDGGRNELLTLFSWHRLAGLDRWGFTARENAGSAGVIMLDLTLGAESLFRQLSETRRNKIRRAMKRGVLVRQMAVDADFGSYYDIYRDWCAFKGLPVQAESAVRSTLSTSNRLVLVAELENKIIGASIFRFQRGGLMEYAANVSRREETRARQNDLLMWRGIEWGCTEGFRRLSLGGAHFFLQTFGGQSVPTYRYRQDRSWLRRHDAKEGLYLALASLFRRLPEWIRVRVRREREH